MPRTSVFFDDLEAAFPENERCPLTLSSASEIVASGGSVLQRDGATHPYDCDKLLQWYDQAGTDPLTRAPLDLRELHPVMTPTTSMREYTHAVRALSLRGWEAEVDADVRRRAPAWKRDHRGDVRDDPLQVLGRSTLQLFAQSDDARQALYAIDLRHMSPARAPLDAVVRRFLEHRRRMWRYAEGQPVYLESEGLAQALHAVYRVTLEAIEGALRAHAPRHSYRAAVADERRYWVLHSPNPCQWFRRIALPRAGPDFLTAFRALHTPDDTLALLLELQRRSSVNFEFTRDEFREWRSRCVKEGFVRHYVRPERPQTHYVFAKGDVDHWLAMTAIPAQGVERRVQSAEDHAADLMTRLDCPFPLEELVGAIRRTYRPQKVHRCLLGQEVLADVFEDPALLPSDPFTNPRLWPALERGLRAMDADNTPSE